MKSTLSPSGKTNLFILSILAATLLYLLTKPIITYFNLCYYLGAYCLWFLKIFYNNFVYYLLTTGLLFAAIRLVWGLRLRNNQLKYFTDYRHDNWKLNQVISGIDKKIRLRISEEGCKAAFSTGKAVYICRTVIQELELEELRALIQHELIHIKNHDTLKMAIARFMTDLYFFIPGLRLLYNKLETENEFTADRDAANLSSTDAVINALLRLTKLKLELEPSLSPSFVNSKVDVLSRIKKLQGGDVRFRPGKISVALTVIPVIAFMVLASQVSYGAVHQSDCLMHVKPVKIVHCR